MSGRICWVYRIGFLFCLFLLVLIIRDYFRGASEVGRFNLEREADIASEVIEFIDSDQKLKAIDNYKNCLIIPSIGVEVAINEGVTSDALSTGIGHYTATKSIGQVGNACYTGHYSTRYKCVFNRLPDIEIGAEVKAYSDKGKKVSYYVAKKHIVNPTDMGVLNDCDEKKLTIITCANNGTQRLVVECYAYTDEELRQIREDNLQAVYDGMDDSLDSVGDVSICSYLKHRGRILRVNYPVEGTISPNIRERFLINFKEVTKNDIS